MSSNSLPQHINTPNELFSRTEIEQILVKMIGTTTAGNLLEYKVMRDCRATGYLGEYFELQMKYKTEKSNVLHETRLFVKTLPYQNPKMSAIIDERGILTKEATIYERLLNELRKLTTTIWCPECYYTRRDLFVMQNIVDLGYQPAQEPTDFLTQTQMDMVLKGLATMHACSITYEERNQVNIGEQLDVVLREVTVTPNIVFYTAGLQAVLAATRTHPAYQSAALLKFIDEQLPRQLDSVYEMVNTSAKYRNVFCHRDLWSGNFLFNKTQPDKVPVAFVDYQLARYCPPAIDVLMVVYLNITPKQRKQLKRWCYVTYYNYLADELRHHGLEPNEQLSYREFEQSLEELELFGVLYNCVSATVLRLPGDFLKE